MTDIVVSGLHLGLDANTITTYWLSYDRDNMMIKYGKGYAMEETTLLICDFSEGVTTAENWHRPVCHHDNWLMGCRRNHGNHGNHAQPWQSWIEEEY